MIKTAKGESQHKNKLSKADVLIIKKRLKKGETSKKISLDYEVGAVSIHNIKHGLTWKHL